MHFNRGNFGSMAGKPISNSFFQNGIAVKGKHAGTSFDKLLEKAPKYLQWVIENVDNHGLTPDQIKVANLAAEQSDDDEEISRSEMQSHNFWRE